MRARRSCRSFQSRNLSDAHRARLMESAGWHSRPDALIGETAIRLEYVAAPLTVWPTVGAHEFLVAIAPAGYDRMAIVDVGRSLQKVLLDATRMGVSTCWIGPGADHDSIRRHLGDRFDPAQDHVICVCAGGYRSRFLPTLVRLMNARMHRRLPLTALFFADPRFERAVDVGAPALAEFGRCLEVCQWSPSSYNGQTTRCVVTVHTSDGAERAVRFDFYAVTASRYYAPVAVGIWCAQWETGCAALGVGGHFEVLTPQRRQAGGAPTLPRYDVSWVVDSHP